MAVLRREPEPTPSSVNIHDVHTILGPESTFEGKLIFDGTVRIDGTFHGEVRTEGSLVIGQGARVHASLFVGHVVVHGEVVGDIVARHAIELHAPARVRGNLSTPELMVAKGVVFEGSSQMLDAPSGAPHGSSGVPPMTMLEPGKI
jgi:cytoskeletal protein CcmA (bactofilin family)